MVRKFLVCALVAACALAVSALDATKFDGNYWSRSELTTDCLAIQRKPNYTVLLTERVNASDLLGLPVVCRFTVSGKSQVFTFRGENVWNTGPAPVSVRIFFTDTDGVYSNITSSQSPNRYWWSSAVAIIGRSGSGDFEVSTTIAPGNFTNGVGQHNLEGFAACARNIRQVGISFCGGWYYDVGIATTSGSADFFLECFDVGFSDFEIPVEPLGFE